MSGVLSLAESRRGSLREVSFEVAGAGGELARAAGLKHTVALIGADAPALAPGLGREGVDEVVALPAPVAEFEAEVWTAALRALIEAEEPDVVLLGHTVDALGVGPAVAALDGLGFAGDVAAVRWEEGRLVAVRGAYGSKLEAELEFDGPALLMLRPGAFAATESEGAATVRTATAELPAPRVEHRGFRDVESGDVDITKAEFLLSIGRGVDSEDELPRFERLAELLGATLSVSRPLVDAGWISNARQVGQSGKTVAPAVYLALGISGAVQHLAGIQKAKTVIAVNTDPDAPIFGVADYGIVADLFDIADALEARLS